MPAAGKRLRARSRRFGASGAVHSSVRELRRGRSRYAATSGGPTWNGVKATSSLGWSASVSGAVLDLGRAPQPAQQQARVLLQQRGATRTLSSLRAGTRAQRWPLLRSTRASTLSMSVTSPVRSSLSLTSSRRSRSGSRSLILAWTLARSSCHVSGLDVLGDQVFGDVARQAVERGLLGERLDDDVFAEDLAGLLVQVGERDILVQRHS